MTECRRSTVPQLITAGVIAHELGVPLHRVIHILRTRQHIHPVARAGNLRLFDKKAVAKVRYEINVIDARKAERRKA